MSLKMFRFIRHSFPAFKQFHHRKHSSKTIFSLSSGQGKCGVAVIRVSGTDTLSALKSLTNVNFNPKPRYAFLRSFLHPKTKDVIDRGLVLWFPGPNSFTGEDSCEFQVHGGLAVVHAMLNALGSLPNLRLAKPGEFTKRAFFNGKMDLTEVEGLADIIHAETEAQRKQALLQTSGALSKLYKKWRQKIVKSIAYLEATIDFAEDENIGDDVMDAVEKNVCELLSEIKNHLNDQRQGEILRDGAQAAIVGEPNVGKSSFLNLICQRNISIVTSIAGTTRDVIESFYNIGGFPVVFADTAGLRLQTDDLIEKEGINRSIDRVRTADLVVLIVDALKLVQFLKSNKGNAIKSFADQHMKSLGIDVETVKEKCKITIANKIDLLNADERRILDTAIDIVPFSCNTSENIERLLQEFTKKLESICGNPSSESPRLTKLRYRHLLTDCVAELEAFSSYYVGNPCADLAIAAQKLRASVRLVEQIIGNVTTEQILDVIFKDFCIGK